MADVRKVVENEIGVPNGSGAMETCHIEMPRPLPCIVILVHGVNDIGEAYPNLDKGICAGLNKRLGRDDLKANIWQQIDEVDKQGNFAPYMKMDLERNVDDSLSTKGYRIVEEGYSPVIPFYWGYRPVDIESYYQDQEDYKQRLKGDDPELPYDSYWIEQNTAELAELVGQFEKLNCDKFGNWLDDYFRRNGGPFSDATTCIPDMYGPGMKGIVQLVAEIGSDPGSKVYENPHRIYMVYAAQRLADLIIKIRSDNNMKEAPINIVAHSQGTIITMLANFIVAGAETKNKIGKYLPADCVILTHSPYAFDATYLEGQSKEGGMGVQTKHAREQTFINFVNMMQLNKRASNLEDLICKGVVNNSTQDENNKSRLGSDISMYYRNNFGKVYNYFSPNDHVVSLRSVEGIGWQGISKTLADRCGNNLYQRIFNHRFPVGEDPNQSICYQPSGQITIELPDYIDRQALINRSLSSMQSSGESYYYPTVQLTAAELAKVKQHMPIMRDGEFVVGQYELASGQLILYYVAAQHILQQLAQDKESNQYNSLETGGVKTARYPKNEVLLNGEQVPEPFIYLADQIGNKTKLSEAIHYGDFYQQLKDRYARIGSEVINEVFTYTGYDAPQESPVSRSAYGTRSVSNTIYSRWIEKVTAQHPEWGPVILIDYTDTVNQFKVFRRYSDKEIKEQLKQRWLANVNQQGESSHHSGITMSQDAPAKIMAYDFALGEVQGVSKTNRYFWLELIHLADWRSNKNNAEGVQDYALFGKLPKEIKLMMNKPDNHQLDTQVINEFRHVKTITQTLIFGMAKLLTNILPKPAGEVAKMGVRVTEGIVERGKDSNLQWPYPDPDTKRKS